MKHTITTCVATLRSSVNVTANMRLRGDRSC